MRRQRPGFGTIEVQAAELGTDFPRWIRRA